MELILETNARAFFSSYSFMILSYYLLNTLFCNGFVIVSITSCVGLFVKLFLTDLYFGVVFPVLHGVFAEVVAAPHLYLIPLEED